MGDPQGGAQAELTHPILSWGFLEGDKRTWGHFGTLTKAGLGRLCGTPSPGGVQHPKGLC